MKILEKLKEALKPNFNLTEEPEMPTSGKLDRYEPATPEEIEYWDRRTKDGKQK